VSQFSVDMNSVSENLLKDRTVWQGVELSANKQDNDYKSLRSTLAHVFFYLK